MKSFEEAVASVNARYEAFGVTHDTAAFFSVDEIVPLFAGTGLQAEDVAKLCDATVKELTNQIMERTLREGNAPGPESVELLFHGALLTVLLVGYELGSSAERDVKEL